MTGKISSVPLNDEDGEPVVTGKGQGSEFVRRGERVLDETEKLLGIEKGKSRKSAPEQDVSPAAAARFMAERRPTMVKPTAPSQLQKERARAGATEQVPKDDLKVR